MRRPSIVAHIAGIVMMFTGLAPAMAAGVEVADPGSNPSGTTPGKTAETGWNPVHTCESHGNIYDLLRCLGGYYAPSFECEPFPGENNFVPPPDCHPPYGPEDYDVNPFEPPPTPPPLGFSIVRYCEYPHPQCPNGIAEPDRLYLKENDPLIQRTHLTLNRPGLVARIGIITETPSPAGGPTRTIEVTFNNCAPIIVTTNGKNGEDQLTYDLIAAIQKRGFIAQFELTYAGPYIKVIGRGANINGIMDVTFRSTDPLIANSDLRIDTPVMDYPDPPPPDM